MRAAEEAPPSRTFVASECADRYRQRWQRFKDVFEFDCCENDVSDLGLSAIELRRLTANDPVSARELRDRLAALHLVREASAKPFIMRDLERVCSHCEATCPWRN